jgi:hypothetical protein
MKITKKCDFCLNVEDCYFKIFYEIPFHYTIVYELCNNCLNKLDDIRKVNFKKYNRPNIEYSVKKNQCYFCENDRLCNGKVIYIGKKYKISPTIICHICIYILKKGGD